MTRTLPVLTLALAVAATAALAEAPVALTATLVAEGFDRPVFVTAPSDDVRLFVLEQSGTIRIVVDGKVAERPFLDLRERVSRGNEQGLLGLAFHPGYAANGRFFIDYTDPSGDTHVDACRVSADQSLADPASCTTVLFVKQPYANHNGGWLGFGPDGYLYVAMGDGGAGGDPQGNGQNRDSLLGKILRIDVDGVAPYAIPPGNPFARGGGAPEIFVLGVRNPWRVSFDGDNLYVADVGQSKREEVSVVPIAAAGANLGWNVMEGDACYRASSCDSTGMLKPVASYGHDTGACSVTGGYVYRGKAIPEIGGLYFFGDYCSQTVWSIRYAEGHAHDLIDWTPALGGKGPISSFGRDSAGELYMTTLDGSLWKIERAP